MAIEGARHRTGPDDPRPANLSTLPDARWHPVGETVVVALLILNTVVVGLSIALPNIAPDIDFFAAPDSPVRRYFGVAGRMGLPMFFSVFVVLCGAVVHAFAGYLAQARGSRVGMPLLVTAFLLLAMAVEEFAGVHDRLGRLVNTFMENGRVDLTVSIWLIPASVLVVVVVAAFAMVAREIHGAARRDMILGLAAFFAAVIGLESLGGLLDAPGTDGPPLQIATHMEEWVKNAGMVLLLRGGLRLLRVVQDASGVSFRFASEALRPGR